MKRLIIGLMTTVSVACSTGCAHQESAKDITTVMVTPPQNSHLAWCGRSTTDCFDAAEKFCSGAWTATREPGMVFPAMIQEGDTWRFMFTCN